MSVCVCVCVCSCVCVCVCVRVCVCVCLYVCVVKFMCHIRVYVWKSMKVSECMCAYGGLGDGEVYAYVYA
jgi:hypothetical protein